MYLDFPGAAGPYVLERTTSIGRAKENDIVLDDPRASRRHAEILLVDGTAMIQDLGSQNGTLLNNKHVNGRERLHDGDTILLGTSHLTFRDDKARARPRLIEIRREARTYPIEHQLSLGRAPTNDVVLSNAGASRRHAQIVVERGDVILYDLESLNGTYVNDSLIAGPCPLRDGDIIAIDDVSFRYRSDPTPAGS
jgi:pSer/pThr/pTyr-binding forkhead associated (FHA) protein